MEEDREGEGPVTHYSQLRKATPLPVYYVDQKAVDPWTLVHAGFGLSAGLVGVPVLLTLAGALLWEALENWKRPKTTIPQVPDWTPEVNLNAVIDILVAMGAWGLGAALASRKN